MIRKQLCCTLYFSSPVSLSFSSSHSKIRHFITFTWYLMDGTWGKESPTLARIPFPSRYLCREGGGDSRARARDLLRWSLSLSFDLGFVSLCGGRGRPMGRTDGDKRLFLARSHPSIVRIGGGTQSANQSISFAVLMLRMVSRIRSTSAKKERRHQINL